MVPKGANTAQAAWGSEGSVEVLPAGGYVWSFKDNGYGYLYVSSLYFHPNRMRTFAENMGTASKMVDSPSTGPLARPYPARG